MNHVTAEILHTRDWMIADMNFRREQTGMEGTPLSPEMGIAMKLRDEPASGAIVAERRERTST